MTKLKGYLRDENNYIIDNYRIWYEIVDDKLWVYDKNDEFVTIIGMPTYWWVYLFEGQENKETELRFERYLTKKLGL
jgi:hypothetical protein